MVVVVMMMVQARSITYRTGLKYRAWDPATEPVPAPRRRGGKCFYDILPLTQWLLVSLGIYMVLTLAVMVCAYRFITKGGATSCMDICQTDGPALLVCYVTGLSFFSDICQARKALQGAGVLVR